MKPALMERGSSVAPRRAPVVPAAAATGLVDFIESQGGNVESVFGNSGIASDMAGAPTLKLSSYCSPFEEAVKKQVWAGAFYGGFDLWFGQQFRSRDLRMWAVRRSRRQRSVRRSTSW